MVCEKFNKNNESAKILKKGENIVSVKSKPAHDVISTLKRRLIDVTVSIRRRLNVDITLCANCDRNIYNY